MELNATKKALLTLLLLFVAAIGYLSFNKLSHDLISDSSKIDHPDENEMSRVKMKKARNDYFFKILRNPATNQIPNNIRAREINHAKKLPSFKRIQQRKTKNITNQVAEGFNWQLSGPPATGGRTRALGIDQRNSDIIIAGGVSGGIWKSIDGGTNWELKTGVLENFSVTSLTQDPTNLDTWYYTSGEVTGNSASAPGASYSGTGIFKSTDNGESWTRISSTEDQSGQFDSQFDYITRIKISPITGTIFTANNGFGIFRSTDSDTFDNLVLGGTAEHLYADLDVASNGDLVAVLSSLNAKSPDEPATSDPGIFYSSDDGQNWSEITPGDFPSNHGRSVLSFAPSNPNIIYVFTNKEGDDTNQGVSFFKIDISGGINNVVSEDRSANLPDFGDPVGGVNTQNGYNMTISVKPNNPDFVTIGATNLFRSTDGFATAPTDNSETEKNKFWIGGYSKDNNVSQYPNQHPDQHVQIYDPNNPNKLWVGHDGGLSVTTDGTQQPVTWTDRNDSYIVTQYYDISLAPEVDNYQLIGGTQDNGTPFFEYNFSNQTANNSIDISSGDGGFSFWGSNYAYVSSQLGTVLRIPRENDGSIASPFDGGEWSYVHPQEASNQLFIHPYALDPNNDAIMYYPGGSKLYRNTEATSINNTTNSDGVTQGWNELSQAAVSGYNITALAVSTLPANTLYYAGSNDSDKPVIKRLDNAKTSNAIPKDISINDAAAGAYVKDIAINPNNGNEALVVMSNYAITGLYHTTDGGRNWEDVEGNLAGSSDPSSANAGPSMRSATIIPAKSGTIYVLGTSTGVYATQGLAGSQTQWGRESTFDGTGEPDIGYSVVENIDSRRVDGDIAIGTHGRGIFVGDFQGETAEGNIPFANIDPKEGKEGNKVTITATNFQFSSNASDNTVTFNGIRAQVTNATSSALTVIVPRGTTAGTSGINNGTYPVTVSVKNNSGTDPQDLTFSIIAPDKFKVKQNYPNPFNPSTTIPIDLPDNAEFMRLSIYNMAGKKVREKIIKDKNKLSVGTPNIDINMSNLASGVYIYRVYVKTANDDALQTKKMTLIK